ncbi:MAG: hypothetical protein V1855_05275 [bacterium]
MDKNTSLSLSLELICLIAWLLKHEKSKLNVLIKRAIKNGLIQELDKLEKRDFLKASEELHMTVLDFLMFLEDSLIENLKTSHLDIKTERTLIPPLKNMEEDALPAQTIQLSIKEAKDQLIQEKQTDPTVSEDVDHVKQVLFEQIIKNWKPSNKELLN